MDRWILQDLRRCVEYSSVSATGWKYSPAGRQGVTLESAGHAVVAQLVEHHLAKVDVAGSSPVNRSQLASPREAKALSRLIRNMVRWSSG